MPANLQPDDTENQSQDDLGPALADISAELFGQGESGGNEDDDGTGGELDGEAHGTDPAPQPDEKPQDGTGETDPAASTEDNSQQVQEVGAPKTWSKEALADWATIPERAKQEILKREEDALRGITMYKQQAEIGQAYDKVVEPYKPLLAAEGVDPVQLFQSFSANHYLLTRGTPEQKVEIARNLIHGYGIDFGALIESIGANPVQTVDPEIQSLRAEIAQLRQESQSRQQQERTALVSQAETEIEAFAKDPANLYFEEVVDDIQRLFQSGQANTLQEAYEKAVWLNPATRAKETERLTAERLQQAQSTEEARRAKKANAQAANLNLDPKPGNGTVPLGSMDDTLAETLARIESRG